MLRVTSLQRCVCIYTIESAKSSGGGGGNLGENNGCGGIFAIIERDNE